MISEILRTGGSDGIARIWVLTDLDFQGSGAAHRWNFELQARQKSRIKKLKRQQNKCIMELEVYHPLDPLPCPTYNFLYLEEHWEAKGEELLVMQA